MKLLVIRPKNTDRTVVWYDGRNEVEIAQELQGHNYRVEVEFHAFGQNLKVHGKTLNGNGCWISVSDGEILTQEGLDEAFDVVESR